MAIEFTQYAISISGLSASNVTNLTGAYTPGTGGLTATVSSPPIELGGGTPTFNLDIGLSGQPLVNADDNFISAVNQLYTT